MISLTPRDRSIPPAIMTNSRPIVAIPMIEDCRTTVKKFDIVKNDSGCRQPNSIIKNINITNTKYCFIKLLNLSILRSS